MDLIHVSTAGPIATLTLNRPDKRNALTAAMLDQMLAAIGAIEANRDVRVLVLRASGDAFCAGVDLREMLEHRESQGVVDHSKLEELFRRLDDYPHPTIAVVQGVAIAGGCELALHCDIRIVSADARFAMPLARIGIVVPYVLAQRLTDLVGVATARDLLFTGDAIDGERAFRLGLATRFAPTEQLPAEAEKLAQRIAANAPLAVREMKRVLRHTSSSGLGVSDPGLDAGRVRVSQSADVREGLQAFLERRPAMFRGV
jgi:enoyl-CoA hydratase/carnithine racemase